MTDEKATEFGGGKSLHDCILAGLEHARRLSLTKDADVSFCIQNEIDEAGLRIVRKPRKV